MDKNISLRAEHFAALSALFKAFGDETRVRILFTIREKECCVCDIAEALDMTASAVSHQLGYLKKSNLVKARRDGKQVLYSLADSHVKTVFGQGLEHILEHEEDKSMLIGLLPSCNQCPAKTTCERSK